MSIQTAKGEFPWGTKGQLNRVGEKLRNGESLSAKDSLVLETWRGAHFHVMNAFQAMLRARTKGQNITVAQRHKRRVTIIDKLDREKHMLLATMNVAGVRLIFRSMKHMYAFRANFLKSPHKHKKKNDDDKYDYVKHPRNTGYRGIHDIYAYNSNNISHAQFNGTMIEVQYRTEHTHAWATANEVVTMTFDQRTKFNSADNDYLDYFKYSSEIFARAYDDRNGLFPELGNNQIVDLFEEIDARADITNRLKALNVARKVMRDLNRAIVLQFKSGGALRIHPVPRFEKEMDFYFNLEKYYPDDDVVLVKSSNAKHIKSAYRNYFSDTTEFISFLDKGKMILRGS